MIQELSVLQLRILLCFLNLEEESCTNKSLSSSFGLEKYVISRACIELERLGLIDRSDTRRMTLTKLGEETAIFYEERINLFASHMCNAGLNLSIAEQEAYYLALYSSEETITAIRSGEQLRQAKTALCKRSTFSGAEFCKHMTEGTYTFPIIFYLVGESPGELRCSTLGFENHGTLIIKDGRASVQLRSGKGNISYDAKSNGTMQEDIYRLNYRCDEQYIAADVQDELLAIPADAFQFAGNAGEQVQFLHGSVRVRLEKLSAGWVVSHQEATLVLII